MITRRRRALRCGILLCLVLAVVTVSEVPASAQSRDSVLNGALVGGAVGAGLGVVFTHVVRDSDLVFSQYARGALIFGAIGAGIGLGVDAALHHGAPSPGGFHSGRRMLLAPAVWRGVAGLAVRWQWP